MPLGPTMRLRSVLILLFALAAATPGEASAQQSDTVWVNLRSRVYHCQGTEFYGRTARGEYAIESVALQRGFRPNGGIGCGRTTSAATRDSASSTSPPEPPPMPLQSGLAACRVLRIVDGDSIHCELQGSVRLIGIDSPEGDQEPFGTAATAALAAIIPEGATLLLEQDRDARDQYGRLLAYAWHDGAQVNWIMVRQGWAVAVLFPPNDRYFDRLRAAEVGARAEGRGLWRVGGFVCLPAEHRRGAC